MFGSLSKTRQKSTEVAGTFSEILVMMRQKSHAVDSEKVGRYIIYSWKIINKLTKLTKLYIYSNSLFQALNRPLLSCFEPHFESEAKCKVFIIYKN